MPTRVISRETPQSPEIEGVVYLPLRKDLWVYFRNGGVTVFLEIEPETWDGFESALSKETFIQGLPSFKVLVTKKKPD